MNGKKEFFFPLFHFIFRKAFRNFTKGNNNWRANENFLLHAVVSHQHIFKIIKTCKMFNKFYVPAKNTRKSTQYEATKRLCVKQFVKNITVMACCYCCLYQGCCKVIFLLLFRFLHCRLQSCNFSPFIHRDFCIMNANEYT